MKHEIDINWSGETIIHKWNIEGYQLQMIVPKGADVMWSITSPANAAIITVDNFDEDRPVGVSWAEVDTVTLEAAAEFAESIKTAVRIAGEFQMIVDTYK